MTEQQIENIFLLPVSVVVSDVIETEEEDAEYNYIQPGVIFFNPTKVLAVFGDEIEVNGETRSVSVIRYNDMAEIVVDKTVSELMTMILDRIKFVTAIVETNKNEVN